MKPLLVANWKANKTLEDVKAWVDYAKPILLKTSRAEIIICSSFTALSLLNSTFKNTTVKIGAQTVSHFEQGAYTGEVTASMLQGLTEYCIVGHSERKRYFNETEEQIIKKIENLLCYKINPIFCIANATQLDSYLSKSKILRENKKEIIFVYEPPGAISVGGKYRAQSPEEAEKESAKFEQRLGVSTRIIYGGSVNPDNISSFLSQKHINGALVGNASLNPETFIKLLENSK